MGSLRVELSTGEPQSPVLPLHQQPHIKDFSYLSFVYILYHKFFIKSIKEFFAPLLATLYGQTLLGYDRQFYRVGCTTIKLSLYSPLSPLKRTCVAKGAGLEPTSQGFGGPNNHLLYHPPTLLKYYYINNNTNNLITFVLKFLITIIKIYFKIRMLFH